MHKLTDTQIKRMKPGTEKGDGGGLYAQALASGRKRFYFRYPKPSTGRFTKMKLGFYPELSLAKARELATSARTKLVEGIDPQIKEAKVPTFGEVAFEYIKANEAGWKHPAHIRRWYFLLLGPAETPAKGRERADDYCASIRDIAIDEITTDHVLDVLKPSWMGKRETSRLLRNKIEVVLDYAKARKYRDGENPASWRGHLQLMLPDNKAKDGVKHHDAMSYANVPAFIATLQSKNGVMHQALEMCILTCLRSKELRGARLSEFDLVKREWTVPAIRMKAGREHVIPLTDRMIEIVEARIEQGSTDYLFAGPQSGKPITDAALSKPLKGLHGTVHGFRSTFRDWVLEQTEFADNLAEMALAHAVGSAVERAYRRGDARDRRRRLMDTWELHCLSNLQKAQVIPLYA